MVPVSDPTDHSRFTIEDSRTRARRFCVVLAVASASWSLSAFLTGGVSFQVGFIPLSSRNPRNPALIATFALIAAWALGPRGERLQRVRLDLQWMLAVARTRLTWLWVTWS